MSAELYEVFSPAGSPGAEQAPPATRVHDLNGKTIGLLSNNQFRADMVLDTVGALVKERYPTATVIPWTEFPHIEAMGDVESRVAELTKVLREKKPDAVVSSTGA
jgi:hypothetical protein